MAASDSKDDQLEDMEQCMRDLGEGDAAEQGKKSVITFTRSVKMESDTEPAVKTETEPIQQQDSDHPYSAREPKIEIIDHGQQGPKSHEEEDKAGEVLMECMIIGKS